MSDYYETYCGAYAEYGTEGFYDDLFETVYQSSQAPEADYLYEEVRDAVTVTFGELGRALTFQTDPEAKNVTVMSDEYHATFSGREFAALVYLLDANIAT